MNPYDWRDYFTWFPKAFGPHIVWLKTIQRQWNPREGCWYYRIKPKETE